MNRSLHWKELRKYPCFSILKIDQFFQFFFHVFEDIKTKAYLHQVCPDCFYFLNGRPHQIMTTSIKNTAEPLMCNVQCESPVSPKNQLIHKRDSFHVLEPILRNQLPDNKL